VAGCVLRVAGDSFDVDAFLASSSLRPCHIYRRGDPGFPASRGPQELSGFNVLVSESDDSLEAQIPDALDFLNDNSDEILRLVAATGVHEVTLDFGTLFRDVAVQGERFPAGLVATAGALGVGLSVTLYPPSSNDSKNEK
jgi:hypothetical protein